MASDENKKARSLSIISFITILYVLGGGSFNKTGSFLGGSIEFSNSKILEYAGLTLLLFSTYRFVLATKFFADVRVIKENYLRQSNILATYIRARGVKEMQICLDTNGMIGTRTFTKGTGDYPVDAGWSSSHRPPLIRQIFRRYAMVTVLNGTSSIQAQMQLKLSWPGGDVRLLKIMRR